MTFGHLARIDARRIDVDLSGYRVEPEVTTEALPGGYGATYQYGTLTLVARTAGGPGGNEHGRVSLRFERHALEALSEFLRRELEAQPPQPFRGIRPTSHMDPPRGLDTPFAELVLSHPELDDTPQTKREDR